MPLKKFISIEERLSESFGVTVDFDYKKNQLTATSNKLFDADHVPYTLDTSLETDGRGGKSYHTTALNTKIWSTVQNDMRERSQNKNLFTEGPEGELRALGYYDI
ncbi:MAG: hypothetical protein ACRBDI_01885 [Alphaproteobacteria bacterium]